MKIKLNGEDLELQNGATIADICPKLGIDNKGIAFAMDNEVIVRDDWADTKLAEGVDVMMIRAVCGG